MLPPMAADCPGSISECEHYREVAAATLAKAESAGSARTRQHYLLLAAYWYECALKGERLDGLPARAGSRLSAS